MSTAKKTKLPYFLQGRIFELVVCLIAFAASVMVMFQIPFTANASSSEVTPVMFTIFGIEALAGALLLRHGSLKTMQDKDVTNPFHRWFFFWLLIPAIFVVQIPWILAGVFNDDGMNTIGAFAMLFFLPWLMVGLGFLALMMWAPIEMTARALYKLIVTRGKDGRGQLAIGAYFLLWVVIVVCGVLAASTERVSYQAHSALLAALLGIPGDYTIKDPTFLWITRILLIIAIALPMIVDRKEKKRDVSRH